MEPLKNLFNKVKLVRRPNPRISERGDAMTEIIEMLNANRRKEDKPWTYSRLAYMLAGIKTTDLYALISKMRDAERRGGSPGATFWLEVRGPKKDL